MIVVLTYDAPHRKTQDLLLRLKAFGHKPIFVVATPWETRKNFQPMIPHRPGEPRWPCPALDIRPDKMCKNLGCQYRVVEMDGLAQLIRTVSPEMVLVGGGGILPADVVKSALIVNSHAAMLPLARGLDGLKWSIYHDLPVGVTLHIIDDNLDSGFIIKQLSVPLYASDTFHAFAMRQYEMEMDLLAQAPDLLHAILDCGLPVTDAHAQLPPMDAHKVYRRMPHLKEMVMMRRFRARRDAQ